MNASYLRKQIVDKVDDGSGGMTGVLNHRNLTLKMMKNARGEWVTGALDFYNQLRMAGFQTRLYWLENK